VVTRAFHDNWCAPCVAELHVDADADSGGDQAGDGQDIMIVTGIAWVAMVELSGKWRARDRTARL
jgi:hypothetical protein